MSNKIITFVDHIGRTIIGESVESTPSGEKAGEGSFIVKNPAIIHVQPTPQGQLNVQTIPLYFRDFVSEKNKQEGTFWKFHYGTCVMGLNVENDARLVDQYQKIFTETPAMQPVQQGQGGVPGGLNENPQQKTIKLFDE